MSRKIVTVLQDIAKTLTIQNQLTSNGNDEVRLLREAIEQVRRDIDVRLRTLESHAHHHRVLEQPANDSGESS